MYKLLVQNSEVKTTWKTSCRWEDNIKRDLNYIEWNGVGFDSGSRWGQVVGSCKHSNEPSSSSFSSSSSSMAVESTVGLHLLNDLLPVNSVL